MSRENLLVYLFRRLPKAPRDDDNLARNELKYRITRRRPIYAAFGVLLLLIIAGGAYSIVVYDTLEERAVEENLAAGQAQAMTGALFIADHQEGLLNRLASIASRNSFQLAVSERRLEQLGAFLEPILLSRREIKAVFLAGPDKKMLLSLPGRLTQEPVTAPLQGGPQPKPWVSPVHESMWAPAEPVVTLAAPVVAIGQSPEAYIGVCQRAEFWQDFFSRVSSRPGRTYHLFDQKGNLVTAGLQGATLKLNDLNTISTRAQERQRGRLKPRAEVSSLRGGPFAFVASAPVNDLDWVLVVVHDYQTAMAPTRAMFGSLVLFVGLLCLSILFAGFVLLARYWAQQRMLAEMEGLVEQRTADLERSSKRYATLVEDLPDMVYELDQVGRFRLVSRSAADILGYRPGDLIGRPYRDLVHPSDRDRFDQEKATARESERLSISALRHLTFDGRVRWLSINSRMVQDDQGRVTGRRGVARDVTEQVKADLKIHELSGLLINAQEEERKRLALDLHDEMGQVLSALKIGLQSVAQGKGEEERPEYDRLIRLTQKIVDRSRALAYNLRPAILDNFGLCAALADLCESLNESGILNVSCNLGDMDEPDLNPDSKTALFRFAQEALTNVTRHSGQRQAVVTMSQNGNGVEVTVSDQGRGFDAGQALNGPGRSLGLLGMRERMSLVGGELIVQSSPEGSTLTARAPMGGST
jgi:PAS domain S-box-containing protein